MRISGEGRLGLWLGVIALAGAGAIEVLPNHTAVGWTLIGIASVGAVLLVCHHLCEKLGLSWEPGSWPRWNGRPGNKSPFIVEFPIGSEKRNELNDYCRRTNLGVPGTPITEYVCKWTFQAIVKNISPKTAKSLRIEARSVSYDRGAVQDLHVPLFETTNLQPERAISFQFVELLMPKFGGALSGFEPVDQESLNDLKFYATPDVVMSVPLAAAVPNMNTGIGIHKPSLNANIHLLVVIYSDDLPPTYVRFSISGVDYPVARITHQGLGIPPRIRVDPVVAPPSPAQTR